MAVAAKGVSVGSDPGVLVTLFLVGVGAAFVVLFYFVIPRREGRRIEAFLQKRGVQIEYGAEVVGDRRLLVPMAKDSLREALRQTLPAMPMTKPPTLTPDAVILAGRQRRFFNVNLVNPFDFSRVELRLISVSPSETRVVCCAEFAEYWRVVTMVVLFTAWGAVAVGMGRMGHAGLVWIESLLVLFGGFFLVVRYLAQRRATHHVLDNLVAAASAQVHHPSALKIE